MSWAEAWRLYSVLALDPSTQVGAALAGWRYPITRADATLRNLFDLTFKTVKRHPKAHERPWDKTESTQMGTRGMSVEDYQAVMARQLEGVEPPPTENSSPEEGGDG